MNQDEIRNAAQDKMVESRALVSPFRLQIISNNLVSFNDNNPDKSEFEKYAVQKLALLITEIGWLREEANQLQSANARMRKALEDLPHAIDCPAPFKACTCGKQALKEK